MARVILRRALEASLERRVAIAAWDDHGVDSIKLRLHRDAGWMDRMFLVPRRPLFMEFKRKGDVVDVDSIQGHKVAQLMALGYDVVAGCDDFDWAMREIRERLR